MDCLEIFLDESLLTRWKAGPWDVAYSVCWCLLVCPRFYWTSQCSREGHAKPTIWCCYHWTLKGRTSMLEVFASKASCHSCRKDWLFREGALGVSCLTGDCVSIRQTFFSHTKLREAVRLQSISISLHMATISRQQWIWYQKPPVSLHASDFYVELGVWLHGLMNVWTTNHKKWSNNESMEGSRWFFWQAFARTRSIEEGWGHPEISHWQAVWSKHLE